MKKEKTRFYLLQAIVAIIIVSCSTNDETLKQVKGDPILIEQKSSANARTAATCGGFYSGSKNGIGYYTYPEIAIAVALPGINLIRNPGFETRKSGTNCPIGPWQDPSTTQGFPDIWSYGTRSTVFSSGKEIIGTPDYLQTCADINSGYNPNNHIYGSQVPRTGDSMTGIIASSPGTVGGTASEYIIQEFDQPLIQGRSYNVEFYVSLADKMKYACNGIGAYFTNNFNSLFQTVLKPNYDNFTPQIPSAFPNSYLTDVIGWTKVSGTYTPSISGVKWIVIGNFRPNNRLTLPIADPGTTISYYYIEDVSVTELPSPSSSISVYCVPYDVPNRFTLYNSSGSNVATTGWIGTANYPGPWGQSLNNGSPITMTAPTAGSATFKLRIETSPPSNINDAWTASVGCN
jgi:hypothetical protein